MRPSNECPSRGPAADEGIIWAPPPSLFQPRSSRLAVPFQPRQRAHSGSFPPSGVSRWGAQIEKVNSGGEKERESEGPPSTAGSAAGDHKVKKTWPHKPTYMSQVPLVPKKIVKQQQPQFSFVQSSSHSTVLSSKCTQSSSSS